MAETDQELRAAVRAGDRRALERPLDRHQNAVFRFGMKMCGEPEEAKEVLQETLIAAARTLPEFRGDAAVSTWLYTMARSFCLKQRRTSKYAPERIESLEAQAELAHEVPDARRGPEEDAAGRQLQRALDAAIARLEPMYREVLVLRDVEGLSAAEVAEVTGLSVDAVKSRLHRARVAVRDRVAPILEPAMEAPSPPAQAVPGDRCQAIVTAFSRRLEGEIDASACAELDGHLQSCARCRGRCESLRATLGLCRSAGAAPVPDDVARSVCESLRRLLDARR